MIKVLICEDQKILLDGIASALSCDKEIEVAGKLTDASKITEFLNKTKVDVLLTDVCTEDGNNSLDFIGQAKKLFPTLKIVVMTGLPEISFSKRARESGADSFVYKNLSTEELISVIKSTYGGYNVFPSGNKKEILSDLTNQELNVLRLFCEGLERKEIAEKLYISESSVKAHISNMLSKTGYNSISRLAIYVVSSGLIIPEEKA